MLSSLTEEDNNIELQKDGRKKRKIEKLEKKSSVLVVAFTEIF